MEIESSRHPAWGTRRTSWHRSGQAAVVDPQRDAWRFTETAERRGWRITHIVETHVHNDYVSGALQAQAATGAAIVAPCPGRLRVRARRRPEEGSRRRNRRCCGWSRWRPLGHTPEHLAWLVTDARPSRLARGRADRWQPAGRQRGAHRPPRTGSDDGHEHRPVRLAPAPGGTAERRLGSCPRTEPGPSVSPGRATPSGRRPSGVNGRTIPILSCRRIPTNCASPWLTRLGRFPTYYPNVAGLNRIGSRDARRDHGATARTPDEVAQLVVRRRGIVVDARDRWTFGNSHIPGADQRGTDRLVRDLGRRRRPVRCADRAGDRVGLDEPAARPGRPALARRVRAVVGYPRGRPGRMGGERSDPSWATTS